VQPETVQPETVQPETVQPETVEPETVQPDNGTSEPRKEVLGMLSRLIKAAVIAAMLALVIESLPDIKRYLELREM
jgi:hypothetical protein